MLDWLIGPGVVFVEDGHDPVNDSRYVVSRPRIGLLLGAAVILFGCPCVGVLGWIERARLVHTAVTIAPALGPWLDKLRALLPL